MARVVTVTRWKAGPHRRSRQRDALDTPYGADRCLQNEARDVTTTENDHRRCARDAIDGSSTLAGQGESAAVSDVSTAISVGAATGAGAGAKPHAP